MEYRSLGTSFVFVVSFLGIFALVIAAMPSGFYDIKPEYEQRLPPEQWHVADIQSLKYSGNTTVNSYSPPHDELTIHRSDLGDVEILISWYFDPYDNKWYFRRWWWRWWPFWKSFDTFWDMPIYDSEIIDAWNDDLNASVIEMTDSAWNYVTFFSYNATLYTDIEDALDNKEVSVTIKMGWEYAKTSLSGWDLITRLLTFQLPNIHPYLNYLIGLPIWASIVYMIFIIITLIVEMAPFT